MRKQVSGFRPYGFHDSNRLLGDVAGESTWLFELGGTMDAETRFFAVTPAAKLTKLQLARLLIINEREAADSWKHLASLSKDELAARLLPVPG